MSIVLQHLTKRYSGYPVVNAISLEVADGEFFVLVGPSGSGKSTVLRLIGGLAGADSGRIFLNAREVTWLAPQERGIGFVFQHYALFPRMSVAENIEFGLRVRRVNRAERRRRREELLELVGLGGLGERLPHQLSGGQQQRVALARALAPRPSVLLLDEPFGALDAKIRVDMRRNLQQIQRELGIATIFVTHDQEEAFALGDRLGVMNAGRLLEVGPPNELYLRPQTEFTATFLGSANLLVGQATAAGIQLGPLHFPLSTAPDEPQDTRRVQVLFRPEDLELAPSAQDRTGAALGQATVEEVAFAGAHERLRLRVAHMPGVRTIAPAVPFGSDALHLEAVRSQEQARRFPLSAGSIAWVGVQRIHALAHPGLSLLLVADSSSSSHAVLALGAQLARMAHARLTVLGAGISEQELQERLREVKEHLSALPTLHARVMPDPPAECVRRDVERQPYDVVVLGIASQHEAATAATVEQALEAGEHHVLLVPETHTQAPTSVLICVAGGEPSKEDVLFAGRLIRHIGARATLLNVLPAEDEQAPDDRKRAERFLEAGARTLATLDVAAETAMRTGPLLEAIQAEMAEGQHDMLVLGAPLRPFASARIRPFLTGQVTYPVLVVRSPYAAANAARAGTTVVPVIEESV